jgi:hypothetical protein
MPLPTVMTQLPHGTRCFGAWARTAHGTRVALTPGADRPERARVLVAGDLEVWQYGSFHHPSLTTNGRVRMQTDGLFLHHKQRAERVFIPADTHWAVSADGMHIVTAGGFFDDGSEFREGHGWVSTQAEVFETHNGARVAYTTLPVAPERLGFDQHEVCLELTDGQHLRWTPPDAPRDTTLPCPAVELTTRPVQNALIALPKVVTAGIWTPDGLVVHGWETPPVRLSETGADPQPVTPPSRTPNGWSPSGMCILVGGENNTSEVLEWETQPTVSAHPQPTVSTWADQYISAVSDDGQRIVAKRGDQTWACQSDGTEHRIPTVGLIQTTAFSRSGDRLFVTEEFSRGTNGIVVRCVDTQTGRVRWETTLPTTQTFTGGALWSDDDERIWVGIEHGLLEVSAGGEVRAYHDFGALARPLPLVGAPGYWLLDLGGLCVLVNQESLLEQRA